MSTKTEKLTEQQAAVFLSLAELVLMRSQKPFAEWLAANPEHEATLREAATVLQAGIALHAGTREAADLQSEIARLTAHHAQFHKKHNALMALVHAHAEARVAHAKEPDKEKARAHDQLAHEVWAEIGALVTGESA